MATADAIPSRGNRYTNSTGIEIGRGQNNFDAVRIGLAAIVVFAHLSDLTGRPEFQTLRRFFDSDFAVKAFFAISGFLVSRSYASSGSIAVFAEKRARRIYPAYLCALMLCLTIGAMTSRLDIGAFIHAPETIRYLIANAALLNFLQPTLPGVFESNPMQAMNGALWTIKVEVALYLSVPILYWMLKRQRAALFALALIMASGAWVYFFRYHAVAPWAPEAARQFPGQLSYFVVGAWLALSKPAFGNLRWILLASTIAFFATKDTHARILIEPFFYSCLVLFLAANIDKILNAGKYGDMSYGIYLYHSPIIQLLYYLGAFENAYLGLATTWAATLGAASCSWHLVERRLLKRSGLHADQAGVPKNSSPPVLG